jgi:hypothetical protein
MTLKKDFLWGVATSAFQLEGSPHADWASWDSMLSSNPDITNHYKLYKEDLNLLRDFIGLIWFAPVVSTTVVWRGNRYIIGKDSVLSPCPETGIWFWRYRFADSIKARLA